MPILPPTITAPYDTVESVMALARVRLNDAIIAGGDVLTDTAIFSQTAFNAAWRRFQQFLANLGYIRLTSEVVLSGLPVAAVSRDPALQAWLNWSQYYDGANYYTPPLTPVLPQDLIQPLKLWERPTGQNAVFSPMANMLDGLPSCTKSSYNRMWEWRQDAIFIPGSTQVMDLRLRYAAFLPDIITSGGVQWYNQPIPIMRCLDPLADYLCYEIAGARGDQNAEAFKSKAEEETKQVFNRDVQAKQRVNVRRQPRSGRSHGGWNVW